MQNNSLVKIFGFLFLIVSIYQLSFTFISTNLERNAKDYAVFKINEEEDDFISKRENLESQYLDSIGNISVYGFTSYNDAKKRELNRGLDLKGGINVILQISVRDILLGLSNNTRNPIFNRSLDEADKLQKQSDLPYIESFFISFDKLKGTSKLSDPDIFSNRNLSDLINFNMDDSEVKPIIRRKIDESITSAFEVLRKRIDKFGVTQPNIQRLGE